MKRTISVILSIIVVCLSLIPACIPVSAAKDDKWMLAEDAEYITYKGKTYYPINTQTFCTIDYSNSIEIDERDLTFATEKTKEYYGGTYLYATSDYSCVVAELSSSDYNFYDTIIYVEESCMEEYEAIASGKCESYAIENYYDDPLTITTEEYSAWLQGEKLTATARKFQRWEQNFMFAYAKSGFQAGCAMILRDPDTDDLYLLNNSEYDRTYYFSDGTFDFNSNQKVTVYKLEDEVLRQEIIDYYDVEYEDELDWLVPDVNNEDNDSLGVIVCCVVFGIIPLFAMAFSIVMLCVTKDKKYHRAYITMLIGSTLALVACVAVILILI